MIKCLLVGGPISGQIYCQPRAELKLILTAYKQEDLNEPVKFEDFKSPVGWDEYIYTPRAAMSHFLGLGPGSLIYAHDSLTDPEVGQLILKNFFEEEDLS